MSRGNGSPEIVVDPCRGTACRAPTEDLPQPPINLVNYLKPRRVSHHSADGLSATADLLRDLAQRLSFGDRSTDELAASLALVT